MTLLISYTPTRTIPNADDWTPHYLTLWSDEKATSSSVETAVKLQLSGLTGKAIQHLPDYVISIRFKYIFLFIKFFVKTQLK